MQQNKRRPTTNKIHHGLSNCGRHTTAGTPIIVYWYTGVTTKSKYKKDKNFKNLKKSPIYLLTTLHNSSPLSASLYNFRLFIKIKKVVAVLVEHLRKSLTTPATCHGPFRRA